jgi:parallel beta-helix repeat protein
LYTGNSTVTGNTIYNNTASGSGGGIWAGTVDPNPKYPLAVTKNTIYSNTASLGGGAYLDNDSTGMSFTGNVVTVNTATSTNGGGIYVQSTSSNFTISGNNLYGNLAAGSPNDLYDGNPSGSTLTAKNNWWGTTNSSAIAGQVYDFFDKGSLGVVNYTPFLAATIPLPDLATSVVSNPPATGKRNGGLTVSDTAANNGAGAASATTTSYYLSTTPSKGSGSFILTGTRLVGYLTPGATSGGTVKVTIPSTVAIGTYYLLACANDNGLVSESSTANNCLPSTTTIQVS